MREPVKGRSEAGRRREDRARHTREVIVATARDLFLGRGYVATTMEAIARAAGVSPATVYQAFGTKQAILERVLDVNIAGDTDAVPVLEREWVSRARKESDARKRLAIVVRGAARVAARTSAIKEVMRDAAATDPAAAAMVEQDTTRRRATQRTLVDVIIGDAPLRPGVDRAAAAATFFAIVNSDTYRHLVGHLGWSANRWTAWLTAVLERQLFD